MIIQDDGVSGLQRSLRLIDNGLLFPEDLGDDSGQDGLRSALIRSTGEFRNFGREDIEIEFKEAWRDIDVDTLKELLEDRGFNDTVINGVLDRMELIVSGQVSTYADIEDHMDRELGGW